MGILNLKKLQRQARRKDKKPHLMVTTVELLCQNTGKAFRKTIHEAEGEIVCWCKLERWKWHLGAGDGNITIDYFSKDNPMRRLDKVVLGERNIQGLAQYDATSGTFVLVDQEKFW